MNKTLARVSYESCLGITARLAAYATCIPFLGATEVNQRQDFLAETDLIEFCIHARRLLENVPKSLRIFLLCSKPSSQLRNPFVF